MHFPAAILQNIISSKYAQSNAEGIQIKECIKSALLSHTKPRSNAYTMQQMGVTTMEQIKKFLRSRGFTLALLACLVAAAAAGVWAVRTVRDELKKSYDDLTTPQEEPAPEPQLTLDPQEDDVWQQPVTDAAESAANVPKPEPPAPSASSSGARSGSGSVHEPSALQGASSPASSSAAPVSTQPVSGRVLNAYSGDELVYSSTLGDWRTHNGVDYACAQDAQVCAPAAGKVTAVDTDGRWGSVVCIEDSAGRIWRVCGTADPAVHTGDEVSVGTNDL